MEFSIGPLDGVTAAEDELRAWYRLFADHRAEEFPDFPVPAFASFAAQRRVPAPGSPSPRRHAWAARSDVDGALLGVGTLAPLDDDTGVTAAARVDVSAAHRRRGIGTALLRSLVAEAAAAGCGRLVQEQVRVGGAGEHSVNEHSVNEHSVNEHWAGEHWARAVGFTETLRNRWQTLDVARTDPARWQVPAPPGFRLTLWTDAAPETLVAAFAAARNAIADAPTGASSYRAPRWRPETVRRAEARARAAGDEARYAVAVHEASGEVAALTGLLLAPPRIDLCWQRDTAVVQRYRGLGLGLVVKAAMMRALVAEHPGLGRVITSTAAQNAAMIRVNERIGYVGYAEIGVFEAEVADIGLHLTTDTGVGTGVGTVPGPRHEPEGIGETEPVAAP